MCALSGTCPQLLQPQLIFSQALRGTTFLPESCLHQSTTIYICVCPLTSHLCFPSPQSHLQLELINLPPSPPHLQHTHHNLHNFFFISSNTTLAHAMHSSFFVCLGQANKLTGKVMGIHDCTSVGYHRCYTCEQSLSSHVLYKFKKVHMPILSLSLYSLSFVFSLSLSSPHLHLLAI